MPSLKALFPKTAVPTTAVIPIGTTVESSIPLNPNLFIDASVQRVVKQSDYPALYSLIGKQYKEGAITNKEQLNPGVGIPDFVFDASGTAVFSKGRYISRGHTANFTIDTHVGGTFIRPGTGTTAGDYAYNEVEVVLSGSPVIANRWIQLANGRYVSHKLGAGYVDIFSLQVTPNALTDLSYSVFKLRYNNPNISATARSSQIAVTNDNQFCIAITGSPNVVMYEFESSDTEVTYSRNGLLDLVDIDWTEQSASITEGGSPIDYPNGGMLMFGKASANSEWNLYFLKRDHSLGFGDTTIYDTVLIDIKDKMQYQTGNYVARQWNVSMYGVHFRTDLEIFRSMPNGIIPEHGSWPGVASFTADDIIDDSSRWTAVRQLQTSFGPPVGPMDYRFVCMGFSVLQPYLTVFVSSHAYDNLINSGSINMKGYFVGSSSPSAYTLQDSATNMSPLKIGFSDNPSLDEIGSNGYDILIGSNYNQTIKYDSLDGGLTWNVITHDKWLAYLRTTKPNSTDLVDWFAGSNRNIMGTLFKGRYFRTCETDNGPRVRITYYDPITDSTGQILLNVGYGPYSFNGRTFIKTSKKLIMPAIGSGCYYMLTSEDGNKFKVARVDVPALLNAVGDMLVGDKIVSTDHGDTFQVTDSHSKKYKKMLADFAYPNDRTKDTLASTIYSDNYVSGVVGPVNGKYFSPRQLAFTVDGYNWTSLWVSQIISSSEDTFDTYQQYFSGIAYTSKFKRYVFIMAGATLVSEGGYSPIYSFDDPGYGYDDSTHFLIPSQGPNKYIRAK